MQQLLHPGIEAGFDFHVGEIVGQRRALHHPNVYAAALDPGFSPFNPFRIGGDQRDLRPLMAVMIKQDPCPDQRSDDREDPHR